MELLVLSLIAGSLAGFFAGLLATKFFAAAHWYEFARSRTLKSLTVQELRIVDAGGSPRGLLHVRDDGTAVRLALANSAGRDTAVFAVSNDGAGLVLTDTDGKPRISLLVDDEDHDALLTVLDKAGKGGLALQANPEGLSELKIADPKGVVRIFLTTTGDGKVAIHLNDSQQRERVMMAVTDAAAAIGILDEKGDTLWQQPQQVRL